MDPVGTVLLDEQFFRQEFRQGVEGTVRVPDDHAGPDVREIGDHASPLQVSHSLIKSPPNLSGDFVTTSRSSRWHRRLAN